MIAAKGYLICASQGCLENQIKNGCGSTDVTLVPARSALFTWLPSLNRPSASFGKPEGYAAFGRRNDSVARSARTSLSNSIGRFSPGVVLTGIVLLCSCDSNFFSRDSKEIASGYHLKPADNPNQFVLTIPNESGGLIIDEIGWREPLIIARASGSQYWDVIDTARTQHLRVSDSQLKSDPTYQSIQITPAETAWQNLNRHKRLW